MKLFLRVGTCAVALSVLSACADGKLSSTALTDMQAVLTDVETATTLLGTALPASQDVSEVTTGLQAVLTALEGDDANAETTALAAVSAAVQQTMADLPANATVQKDGAAALTLLRSLTADSSETVVQQAYAAAGALLIDYLQTQQTVSVHYGAASGEVQQLLDDASTHLHAIGGR